MKLSITVLTSIIVATNAFAGSDRKPAQSKGKAQDCLVQASALAKSKFPGVEHNSDNADTADNFLFYIWKNGCWFDVNVSAQDKTGQCILGKPTLDEKSANCG